MSGTTTVTVGICAVAGLSLAMWAPASAVTAQSVVTARAAGAHTAAGSAARPKYRWEWFASKAKGTGTPGVQMYQSGSKRWFWETLMVPGGRATYKLTLPKRCRQIRFSLGNEENPDPGQPGVRNETRFTLQRSGRIPKAYAPITLTAGGAEDRGVFKAKKAKQSTRFILQGASVGDTNDEYWYTYIGMEAYCRRR